MHTHTHTHIHTVNKMSINQLRYKFLNWNKIKQINTEIWTNNVDKIIFFVFIYCFFTIYSRYLKRVISKRDGCEYLKQVPSSDGSLELI
jgi:hypothetical protein